MKVFKWTYRHNHCVKDWLLTKYTHVIFAFLFVLVNQVFKVVGEVLEEKVLLVHLQAQNPIQEFSDGAI